MNVILRQALVAFIVAITVVALADLFIWITAQGRPSAVPNVEMVPQGD
jgi:hypothetical protein